jgi:hypothetical protein
LDLLRDDFEWVMSLDFEDQTSLSDDDLNRLFGIFGVTSWEDGESRYMEIINHFGGDHGHDEVDYEDVAEIFMNRWNMQLSEDDFDWVSSLDLQN